MSEASMLQCILGMKCKDFVIIAADKTNTQSLVIMNNDVDKLVELSDTLLMVVNGEPSDIAQVSQYIQKNMDLYKLKNKYGLNGSSVVHFIRKTLSDALRSGTPVILNCLIGGFDEVDGPHLQTMDFLASCVKVDYAAHGFGGFLSLSILQHYYRPDLTLREAYAVLKLCVDQIHRRLAINIPSFGVKAASKHGVLMLPDITPETFT